jgi:curli production assembly/transport component CsgG
MVKKNLVFSVFLLILMGCGARLKVPFEKEEARIGENTTPKNHILGGVLPVEPIVVGVYKFRDQTGQYKLIENGTSWSTAVTQGATTILLKSLEDSKWFTPIERENVSNLLNERQIIRSTRKQYDSQDQNNTEASILPPLLFAGIILEGGIISYDTNILTGGVGARYFGTGASSKYREDRITIYLRAVSTSSGKILKTVYISKTILSQAISASVFKFVDVKRLLEAEVGMTQNEPKQLAVKEAIDKAVENLITEGIIDGLWSPQGGKRVVERITKEYAKEVEETNKIKLYNRKFEDRRSRNSLGLVVGGAQMKGDYADENIAYNFKFNYKHIFNNKHFSIRFGAGVMEFDRVIDDSKKGFITFDGNMEYMFLPYDNISPYLYGGAGYITDYSYSDETYFKTQFGVGLEFFPFKFLGVSVYGEQNITFTDKLDGLVQGKRDDYFWRFGVGLNFYFGKGK